MKVRFLVAWRGYTVGQVLPEWDHPGAAEELRRRGIIEILVDPPAPEDAESLVPQQTVRIEKKGRR